MNRPTVHKMPDFVNVRTKTSWTTALGTLYQLGTDLAHVNLLAVGPYENYRGEIRKQSPDPGTPLTGNTQIVLEVGVSSAVDFMPYQFFYGLDAGVDRGSEWEDRARELMSPFDAAYLCREAVARQQSVRYSFGTNEPEHITKFLNLFDLSFDARQWLESEVSLWSVLMPSYHLWAGNPDAVALVLKLHFGYDFEIVENVPATFPIPGRLQCRLGSPSAALGQYALLGGSFTEFDSSYEVVVEGAPPADIVRLLPNGDLRRKIEWVLDICMPSNLDYQIKVQSGDRQTRLGDKDQTVILGFTAGL
ncbi:MAG: hypothetical protein DRP45_02315 [Candidatus Zixiibacteriota bacterium]|nr:MAG: hypothetical protein DRP45_02315 [candidate division Zixibacteria bacterium]